MARKIMDRPIVNCSYSTKADLYMAYMPFIKDGGLFVRTNLMLPLGAEANLSVKLLNESYPSIIPTKVVWITPRGSQGNKPAGLGFQFIEDDHHTLKNKIETYLDIMLKSSQMTDTM